MSRKQQALIIGLGQFGRALARTLASRGVEVIAVDTSELAVQMVADVVADCMVLDASIEASLAQLEPARRDLCVCTIGSEARDAAIVVTALLRQMGAPRVVARANDDTTERILRLVGAHEVVNPERAFGERLATRLLYSDIIEEFPLGDDLVISEIRPPRLLLGRSLRELDLRKRTKISVVAIRREVDGRGRALIPTADDRILAEDILVVVAPRNAVQQLLEAAT
jgi:trk system potassium uptake protein TrkA